MSRMVAGGSTRFLSYETESRIVSGMMMTLLMRLMRFRSFHRPVGWMLSALRLACGSDRRFTGLLERTALGRLPRARAYFRHYLRGGTGPVAVPVGDLFSEDRGFAAYAARLMRSGPGVPASGWIDVPQWRLTHPDWRMALGSFQFRWIESGDGVAADIRGTYDWHPAERRVTRAVHAAADLMKRAGASAFSFAGCDGFITREQLDRAASIPLPRTDRLYM